MATVAKNFFNNGSGTSANLNKSWVRPTSNNSWGIMHTPPDGTSTIDEMWVWVAFVHSSYHVQYGIGASSGNVYQNSPCNTSEMKFPTASPPWLVVQGQLMQDNETVMGIKNEYTSYGNWCGYVHRITP